MKKIIYFKDGVEIQRPEQVYINGEWVHSPTDNQLLQVGYELREILYCPVDYIPSYEEEVTSLIRTKYSADEEFAILRQRDRKPLEFAEYDAYCEECKSKVKSKRNIV